MAWYPDLTACDYFDAESAAILRAVGWLERGCNYPTGSADSGVFSKLVELRKSPWQPAVAFGFQECTLCQYEGEMRGVNNLFIPGDGIIYVCPEMITHYMNAHGYAPPAEFGRAVLACPPMRSMDYMKLLLANGGRILFKSPQA